MSTRSTKVPTKSKPDPTSWGEVAKWYDSHLEGKKDTYHEKVVYPNLLRMISRVTDAQKILDLACGQGQFSRLLAEQKLQVSGVDISKELIEIAKRHKGEMFTKPEYLARQAHDLKAFKNETFDTVVCILALQNIKELEGAIQEVSRVTKKGGRFILVLNHPMYRNPRHTSWGVDEEHNIQYRRIDEYLSESHVKIDMTPGSKDDKKFTVSFHRPLQVYVKFLTKHGFLISRLEEWTSHRKSERGPHQAREDKSRKEIPLFMCIEVVRQ